MAGKYLVQNVEMRKRKNGEDYLLLKIDDKFISFFEPTDIQIPVKAGQYISCRIVQKGTFRNGYNLKIETEDLQAPPDSIPDNIGESKSDLKNALFSEKITSGNKIYFLDVNTAKNGAKYLRITESGGNLPENANSRVIVFEDHLKEFIESFIKAVKLLGVDLKLENPPLIKPTESSSTNNANDLPNAEQ